MAATLLLWPLFLSKALFFLRYEKNRENPGHFCIFLELQMTSFENNKTYHKTVRLPCPYFIWALYLSSGQLFFFCVCLRLVPNFSQFKYLFSEILCYNSAEIMDTILTLTRTLLEVRYRQRVLNTKVGCVFSMVVFGVRESLWY